jgi:Mg2+-importing ATPase
MSIITDYSIGKSPEDSQQEDQQVQFPYWSYTVEKLFSDLNTTKNGLQPAEAELRLKKYGLNSIRAKLQATAMSLLLSQFKSPLVLILIFAAIVSGIVQEWVDASIVLAIVLGSTILGFVQEYTASNAVEKLRSQVTIKSNILV